MDDLLYFLLLIGWLAFSFYQQNAKKKKKQAQMQAAKQRELLGQDEFEAEADLEQNYQPRIEEEEQTIKTVFENFLTGEQTPIQKPVWKEEIPAVVDETEEYKGFIEKEKNIYQKYYDEKLSRPGAIDDDVEHHQELQEEDGNSNKIAQESNSHFDLRKAVIYSEILNRPYAN